MLCRSLREVEVRCGTVEDPFLLLTVLVLNTLPLGLALAYRDHPPQAPKQQKTRQFTSPETGKAGPLSEKGAGTVSGIVNSGCKKANSRTEPGKYRHRQRRADIRVV
jgi:hypothetical protein